jgi:hypothetical protein
MGTSWKEYKRLKDHLESLDPGTDEFDRTLDQLNKLVHIMMQVQRQPAESKLDKFLSNPALINGVFSLGIALLVLNYERLEIITSRAFNFVKIK